MVFLPKSEILKLEELAHLAAAFIDRGVRKIRITGGEPLVRPGVIGLFQEIGERLGRGLDELTLTTNGTQLSKFADDLRSCGIKRINVSLDTRAPETFKKITRRGNLGQVLEGIDAALDVGLKVKINMVALKDVNESEVVSMIEWAHSKKMDLTLIEVMPMGDTGEHRFDQFLPLQEVRRDLESKWTLIDEKVRDTNGGPSVYSHILGTGGRIGFITPLTNNFCATCNRVRVTCTGRIYMCLGQEDHIDLREVLRNNGDVNDALDRALFAKPERHDFEISKSEVRTGTDRHMSTTGG